MVCPRFKLSDWKKRVLLGCLALSLCAFAERGEADVFLYNFNTVVPGTGSTPAGNAPWLTAQFSTVSNNEVQLQLSAPATGLQGGQFVSDWYFNFSGNPTQLTFTQVTSTVPGTATITTGSGSSAITVAGAGKYNIDFSFPNASNLRFNAGESVTYNIFGSGSLSASMFNILSTPVSGSPTYYAAAQLQQNSNPVISTSSVIQIPEPGTYLILGSLLAITGLSILYMKKRSHN